MYSYKDGVEVAYIYKDGVRVSGTELYSPYSERYDRSRLQAMFSNVTVWTLASFYSDDSRFAEHAAECVRVWFIRNETRMNPHLMYAQYVPGLLNSKMSIFLWMLCAYLKVTSRIRRFLNCRTGSQHI